MSNLRRHVVEPNHAGCYGRQFAEAAVRSQAARSQVVISDYQSLGIIIAEMRYVIAPELYDALTELQHLGNRAVHISLHDLQWCDAERVLQLVVIIANLVE